MTVLASTDFSGADVIPIGGVWSVTPPGGGNWGRASNNAEPEFVSIDAFAYENTVTWPSSQYAKAILSAVPAFANVSNGVGVALRMSTGATVWYELTTGDGGAGTAISKRNAGLSLLASVSTNFAVADEIYLEAKGSSLVAQKNGALFGLSATDSAIGSGRAGIAHSGEGTATTAGLASWEGGDFTGPPFRYPKRVPLQQRLT
jgi:hypothetical protein